MKTIEITGIAGVGKSYVMKNLLNNRGVISDKELIKRYHITDIYLLYKFFRTPNSLQLLKLIIDISKELNMSILNKINFIRNTIKKIGKQNYFSKIEFVDGRVVLVDEGISHLYQNVVTGKTQNNLKIFILLNKLLSLVKLPDRVIVVDAPKEVIVERLKERGHKRVSKHDIEHFVDISKKNLSIVYKRFPNIKTVINK